MTATPPDLTSICSIDDIFHRHLLVFLAPQDAGRLESTSTHLHSRVNWKVLCERDFSGCPPLQAPIYSPEQQTFDSIQEVSNWKVCYEKWYLWHKWTAGGAKAEHLVQAVDLWGRFKTVMEQYDLDNVLQSLNPPLEQEVFRNLADKIPSSLVAFFSVHGGQALLQPRSHDHEFFAGIFGSYSCYNHYYSMRLFKVAEIANNIIKQDGRILVAASLGNPRVVLNLKPTTEDPEGIIYHDDAEVGQGGILTYFQTYVKHLEAGVYKPAQILEESTSARGIGLFPDAGPLISRAVTRGIEVRASARWFPGGSMDVHGLNFGYSIRIQMVEELESMPSCQLLARHWEFMDGNGNVRRVDGEAVVGKQPLFFRENGKAGFTDLGPAGDGHRCLDKVFVYQSQSGPVQGTTQENTGLASVKGTFSFRPGSIDSPTGPIFHVTVAEFPLKISTPFY